MIFWEVPPWLNLMLESLPSLLWACLLFTVPLTLLSFAFGLAVGFGAALVRLFAPWPLTRNAGARVRS